MRAKSLLALLALYSPLGLCNDDLDLSNQFSDEVPVQGIQDSTCHVYASTALAEAACFRRTGKKVAISDVFVLVGHYLDLIASEECNLNRPTPLFSGDSINCDPLFSFEFVTPPNIKSKNGTGVPDWDGGSSIENLGRINNGWACGANEFPALAAFSEQLSTLRFSTYAIGLNMGWFEASSQKEQSRKIRKHFIPLFRNWIKKEFGFQCETNLGTGPWTRNAILDSCLKEPFKIQQRVFSSDLGNELLARGIPWICGASVKFNQTTRELVELNGKNHGHATVVIGKKANGSWIVRDSLAGKVQSVKGTCKTITWIE